MGVYPKHVQVFWEEFMSALSGEVKSPWDFVDPRLLGSKQWSAANDGAKTRLLSLFSYVTEWYPTRIRPARSGLYHCRSAEGSTRFNLYHTQGDMWFYGAERLEVAQRLTRKEMSLIPSNVEGGQVFQWRGLIQPYDEIEKIEK